MASFPRFFWLFGIVFLLSGCDEYCDRGTTVAMVVGFYRAGTETKISLQYEMTGVEAEVLDSAMLRKYAQFALVPLSNAADTSVFALRTGEAKDTLVVVSRRAPALVSAECGAVMYHTIDEVYLRHPSDTIREVRLNKPEVKVVSYREDRPHEENIQLFF